MTNKETVKAKNVDPASGENNNLDKSNFVEETKQELAKVVWPSRQQLLSESVAVILMVTLVATVIYLVDKVFGWAAGKVF
ncbi:preprotein translocase subunit SecE [Geminocystis herdmanii]|uniref:preprotein translocase subunit SecE n=1 Tax=Geminocystis herdmanii TaxID=669359 RepID=UPI00034B5ABB|nr:preprotein translocase subunit SecE [Geminocystis herdmanii]